MNLEKLPIASGVDRFIDWVTEVCGPLFNWISMFIQTIIDTSVEVLGLGPSILLIILITLLVLYTNNWGMALLTFIGLLLIDNLGLWDAMIQTLALVLASVLITVIVGVPIGIWASQSNTVKRIIMPILDFMQTMPGFVYLIPAILFFGIGVVPGIVASFIFAVAPTIRMTNLGIREVPADLIEASQAFGSTTWQKITKVQLPLAVSTIMAGINQSIMLSLSMVVMASLVGAPGLGAEVYRAVSQIAVGEGFEAGLALVIIAIILDRLSQNLRTPVYERVIAKKWVYSFIILIFLGGYAYIALSSSAETGTKDDAYVGNQVDYKIVGIEPGAGIMSATEEVLKKYGLEEDWTLQEGSSAAMVAELQKAYDNQDPIILTGWTPHWKFQKYDLKYLDDPKNVYGQSENIHTLVRKGLKEELPGAEQILDQFYWTPADMEEVMVDMEGGMTPKEAAAKWIEKYPNKVDQWLTGAEKGEGQSISLIYVAWESEIASTNVIGEVLRMHGYSPELKQVEIGPMFASIANQKADAMVAAWLPLTHNAYYDKYKEDLTDLGPNLKGAKSGLVVPTYMDIDSIEDLVKE